MSNTSEQRSDMSGGGAAERHTTPNSVLAAESIEESQPIAKKQKQEDEVPKPKRTFKGVANLVLAMKRFQGEK